jgi:hypothetical protein
MAELSGNRYATEVTLWLVLYCYDYVRVLTRLGASGVGSLKLMKYRSAWRRGMNHRSIAAIGLNTAYQRNPRLFSVDTTLCRYQE